MLAQLVQPSRTYAAVDGTLIDSCGMSNELTIARASNKFGWLHTFRSCISTFIMPRKGPLFIAFRVVDRAIQMFGGMGVAQEMPLERWLRELRIKRIGEGPSEVHRMVIARNKLKSTDGGVYFG